LNGHCALLETIRAQQRREEKNEEPGRKRCAKKKIDCHRSELPQRAGDGADQAKASDDETDGDQIDHGCSSCLEQNIYCAA
jgi:hypothetical protein